MSTQIYSTIVRHGRHAEKVPWRDDRYVKCWHCGFVCHLDRNARAHDGNRRGAGVSFVEESKSDLAYGQGGFGNPKWGNPSDVTLYNPTVTGGCPQCGCLSYDNKPA